MKSMSCDLCDKEFSAETFEAWFELMKPHYMSDHADVMAQNKDKTKEDGMKWMSDMKSKFESI
jgi:hypothetical protein